jgi:hypothetical protein
VSARDENGKTYQVKVSDANKLLSTAPVAASSMAMICTYLPLWAGSNSIARCTGGASAPATLRHHQMAAVALTLPSSCTESMQYDCGSAIEFSRCLMYPRVRVLVCSFVRSVADMIHLEELTEAAILHTLRVRFQKDQIYVRYDAAPIQTAALWY